MKLYYSGASILNGEQNNPLNSIGGFMSSSLVPNGLENSLFPNVNSSEIENGSRHIIGLFLKNDTGAPVSDIDFYFDKDSESIFTYEIGAVQANTGEIESLVNSNALPFSVNFQSADGDSNKVRLVNSLDDNEIIGLWIIRKLAKETPTDFNCADFSETSTQQSFTLKLQLEWV